MGSRTRTAILSTVTRAVSLAAVLAVTLTGCSLPSFGRGGGAGELQYMVVDASGGG